MKANKKCDIKFNDKEWSQISPEGKDLTMMMLEKNPKLRLSAKEAMNHPWFTLEHFGANKLSIAQANINKYCNERYFNMEDIKPEFGSIVLNHSRDNSYLTDSMGNSTVDINYNSCNNIPDLDGSQADFYPHVD